MHVLGEATTALTGTQYFYKCLYSACAIFNVHERDPESLTEGLTILTGDESHLRARIQRFTIS